MDLVSHALIGNAIGSALCSVAPDVPVLCAAIVQVAAGDESLRDVLLDHRHPTAPRPLVAVLLWIGKAAHAWYVPALLLPLYPLGALAWWLHLVIDAFTHRVTFPLWPSRLKLKGPVSWQHLSLWKYLAWIPLAALSFL